ncbi:unnamed protein product [Didymodactylos carnosus]|uniref:Transmembrane protein 143 n=1 Tax=Didymodactylos carnosus TaxID=1234261 RepID=A0A813U9L4_9BILA|nr:unnamed protein product [Didymodactylos carnosus]CAF0823176.1 unnamed protein product [Didymodactylos carnosus]CAF3554294.1 unnamed protein product [Didymodactylos carnosus]CAF3609768.1 unnamed protein product [Didymodactylos carnosus]
MLSSYVRFILFSSTRGRLSKDLRSTQKHLLCISKSLSTVPYKKLSEETNHRQDNYSDSYNSVNRRKVEPDVEKKKEVNLKRSIENEQILVAANDLLEAKRFIEEEKKVHYTSEHVSTSTEKFSLGLEPIQSSSSLSSMHNTGELFRDAKLAPNYTPVLPGTPTSPPQTGTVSSSQSSVQEPTFNTSGSTITSRLQVLSPKYTTSEPYDVPLTQEHFIPITRPSLIRLIATDSNLLAEDERFLFHQLCSGLDSAVVQRYHPVLNELKHLFDPLNPDNETHSTRKVSYRDKLDNEYWLLQKIDDILMRANFSVLPKRIIVDKLLTSEQGTLNVKINGYDYDVLKIWILGRESMPNEYMPWYKRLFRFGRKPSSQPTSTDYFKRIILAVRLKGQDRLYLKAFRDVSLQSISQLLPTGRIQIGRFEQQLLWLTLFTGSATVITKLVTTMADIYTPSIMLVGGSLTLFIGGYGYKNYMLSKFDYFSSMNHLLFYKNIANNKSLLTMIVDRAEDELSKEILLVYIYLLSKQKLKQELTLKTLEIEIENWLRQKTNSVIHFNSVQSVEFLKTLGKIIIHLFKHKFMYILLLFLGILQQKGNDDIEKLHVIPMRQAVGILPMVNRTLSEKNEEMDLIEGYDKKYYEIDWKTILDEDRKLKKGGWA